MPFSVIMPFMRRILNSLFLLMLSLLVLSCSTKREYMVRMHTTAGVVDMVLYNETPGHRDNFVKLVKEQQYDSLLFHRVIKDFMIQGGDPASKYAKPGELLGEGDLGYTLKGEFMLERYFHKRGVLAAAREGDDVNPEKASSACQFYIVWGRVFTQEQLDGLKKNYRVRFDKDMSMTPEQEAVYRTVGGTPHLDGNYTVFGEVTAGLEVVEAIQNVPCDRNDRPIEDVRILRMELIKKR